MKSSSVILAGKVTALFSFIVGTGIMFLFYLTNSIAIANAGLVYIILTGCSNLMVLALLISQYFKDRSKRKQVVKTSAIMLLNIPVVLAYCWFALFLLDTIRIRLRNVTNVQLTNIRIGGCEERFIATLPPGQSNSCWLHIPYDCAVYVDYDLEGKTIREDISGYTSKGMGQIIRFDIRIK